MKFSTLIILTMSAILFQTLLASPLDSVATSTGNSISGKAIIGYSNKNYNIGLGIEFQHAQSLYTFRFIKGVEYDLHFTPHTLGSDTRERPLEATNEYSVLYGKFFQVPYGRLSVSLGLGLMQFRLRGAPLRWIQLYNSNGDNINIIEHEVLDYSIFNVPYEIQFTVMPNPFGVSLSIFGNVNSHAFMVGITASAILGMSFQDK